MGNTAISVWNSITSYLVDFWYEKHIDEPVRWTKLILWILVVVASFFVLNRLFPIALALPIKAYYTDFLFLELLKGFIGNYYLLVIVLGLLVYFNEKLFIPWSSLQRGKTVRNFVLLVCAILVWKHCTHDYNMLFDQGYYKDRSLLVFSLILVYWRPFFTVLFLCILFPLVGQLEVLEVYARSTTFLLSRVVMLFIVFFLVNLINKGFRFAHFVFMTGCLVAANYFVSGSGKIMLVEWIFNNRTNNLIAATYANGWHSNLGPESISEMIRFMGKFNVLTRLFSVAIECGLAFMFIHIKWARLLFLGAIMMHLGIIFYSGIFFWMWMSLLVGLLFLFRTKMFKETLIFNKRYFILSIILIVSGRYWVGPSPKVWFDSPLTYTYRFEAEMENGSSKMLPPNYFSPYDVQFTFGSFKYLNDGEPLLDVLWGASGSRSLHAFFYKSARSAKEIYEYEKKHGKLNVNQSRKTFFVLFIKEFIGNRNKKNSEQKLISYIKAPRLLLTYPKWQQDPHGEKIINVSVYEITSYYSDEAGYAEIRNRKLMDIPIYKEAH